MAEVIKNGKKNKKFRGVSKKREDPDHTTPAEGGYDDSFDIANLTEDIEDYLKNSLESQNTQTVPLAPVIKFNKNWTLSVTELSCQLWCEKQVEYTLLTGRKRVTEEMLEGIKRHEELELEDHDLVEVEIETEEDYLGLKLLNSITLLEQLLDTGKCRELWLFDTLGSYTFCGVIDQLTVAKQGPSGGKSVVISDTKTRKTRREPSPQQVQGASLQVQLYCIMMEDSRSGTVDFERLFDSFKCDKLSRFTAPELRAEGCLADLANKYLKAFRRLPKISTTMQLEYEHEGEVFSRSEVSLRRENILATIDYLCTFWDGEREADHVRKNEAWKCRLCQFKDECTVTPLIASGDQ